MRAIIAAAIMAASAGSASSYRPPDVDAIVSLVADVSLSMTDDEKAFQRDAYAAAFRSHEVIDAIESGPVGCIGVNLIYFANLQQEAVGWSKICNAAQANAFALAVSQRDTGDLGSFTAIGSAMRYAFATIQTAPFYAPPEEVRRIIDVSADGTTNDGERPDRVRAEITAAGVTINGLPILIDPEFDKAVLAHFTDDVVGGPSHFLEPVYGLGDLPRALRRKLVLEIAGVRT